MKKENPLPDLISQETIEARIYYIRGKRVMLDRDLAALYGVETKVFNQASKGIVCVFLMILCFNYQKKNITL